MYLVEDSSDSKWTLYKNSSEFCLLLANAPIPIPHTPIQSSHNLQLSFTFRYLYILHIIMYSTIIYMYIVRVHSLYNIVQHYVMRRRVIHMDVRIKLLRIYPSSSSSYPYRERAACRGDDDRYNIYLRALNRKPSEIPETAM